MIHILNQFVWPDSAPTSIYATAIAETLHLRGHRVRLVGGSGHYRAIQNPRPISLQPHRLKHYVGDRQRLFNVAREYWAVARAFRRYIEIEVNAGDLVLLTSAPPTTVNLHQSISKRGAFSIYRLDDYMPPVISRLAPVPAWCVGLIDRHWRRQLSRWDLVVKTAANLGYEGSNVRVIRNWATLEPDPTKPYRPKTALYAGNLGMNHCVYSFLKLCRRLHRLGYEIDFIGDGPGAERLPDYVRRLPPPSSEQELTRLLEEHEVHLIAAHPEIRQSIFPSKFWNSLTSRRRIIGSGFKGEMKEEWRQAKQADHRSRLEAWVTLIEDLKSS